MARPIIPIAVRRTERDEQVEVQSKGGTWIPWGLLSDASTHNVYSVFSSRFEQNDRDKYGFPTRSFFWLVGAEEQRTDLPEPQPEPQQQTEQQEQERDDVQDAPDTERNTDEQDQEDDPMPQNAEQQPPTLEELVRRLAREEAVDELDNARPELLAEVNRMLLKFQAETSPTTQQVTTTRIEVKTPTVQVTHDGLFHEQFPTLLHNAAIGMHTFLPGPPGSGKTHAAEQVAETLGWRYVEISFSPDLPESRIWGGRTPDGFIETPLLEGLRHAMDNPDSGLVALFDEMDAARASLLVGMNSAMANCRVTAPNGDRLKWGDNVVFIGAANTFGTGPTAEFAGRNKLDAATLDRFAYIPWDTDPIMESSIVRSFLYDDKAQVADAWLDAWRTLRDNVKSYGLKTFVTMRGARNGARLIASGIDMHKAMMLVAGNKLPADQWSKVCPL